VVSVAQNIGILKALQGRAEAAAVPAAGAMGRTYKSHLIYVTLLEHGAHPPVTQTPSPPGAAPSMITGRLRGSVTMAGPFGGGGIGESSVQPNTIYAATQQWGGVHHGKPLMWLWAKYIGHVPGFDKEVVHIPSRPYMTIAVDEEIASGGLHRSAEEAFIVIVWG
jgi:hypothetical protein